MLSLMLVLKALSWRIFLYHLVSNAESYLTLSLTSAAFIVQVSTALISINHSEVTPTCCH